MKKRIDYIDVARGIGCLLVICIHMPTFPLFFRDWLNSFVMQMYFFVSGYFLKEQDNVSKTISKSVKNVLLPYYIYSLIFIILDFSFCRVRGAEINKEIVMMIKGYGSWGVLWFFFSLFWIKILVRILVGLFSNNRRILFFFLLIISSLGYWKFNLYTHIQNICVYTIFYYIGFLFSNYSKKEKVINKINFFNLILIAIINIAVFTYVYDRNISLVCKYYLRFLIGMTGVIFLLKVSFYICSFKVKKILVIVGKNSFFIFPLMAFVPNYFVNLFIVYFGYENAIVKIIGKLIGVIVCIIVICLNDKYHVLINAHKKEKC